MGREWALDIKINSAALKNLTTMADAITKATTALRGVSDQGRKAVDNLGRDMEKELGQVREQINAMKAELAEIGSKAKGVNGPYVSSNVGRPGVNPNTSTANPPAGSGRNDWIDAMRKGVALPIVQALRQVKDALQNAMEMRNLNGPVSGPSAAELAAASGAERARAARVAMLERNDSYNKTRAREHSDASPPSTTSATKPMGWAVFVGGLKKGTVTQRIDPVTAHRQGQLDRIYNVIGDSPSQVNEFNKDPRQAFASTIGTLRERLAGSGQLSHQQIDVFARTLHDKIMAETRFRPEYNETNYIANRALQEMVQGTALLNATITARKVGEGGKNPTNAIAVELRKLARRVNTWIGTTGDFSTNPNTDNNDQSGTGVAGIFSRDVATHVIHGQDPHAGTVRMQKLWRGVGSADLYAEKPFETAMSFPLLLPTATRGKNLSKARRAEKGKGKGASEESLSAVEEAAAPQVGVDLSQIVEEGVVSESLAAAIKQKRENLVELKRIFGNDVMRLAAPHKSPEAVRDLGVEFAAQPTIEKSMEFARKQIEDLMRARVKAMEKTATPAQLAEARKANIPEAAQSQLDLIMGDEGAFSTTARTVQKIGGKMQIDPTGINLQNILTKLEKLHVSQLSQAPAPKAAAESAPEVIDEMPELPEDVMKTRIGAKFSQMLESTLMAQKRHGKARFEPTAISAALSQILTEDIETGAVDPNVHGAMIKHVTPMVPDITKLYHSLGDTGMTEDRLREHLQKKLKGWSDTQRSYPLHTIDASRNEEPEAVFQFYQQEEAVRQRATRRAHSEQPLAMAAQEGGAVTGFSAEMLGLLREHTTQLTNIHAVLEQSRELMASLVAQVKSAPKGGRKGGATGPGGIAGGEGTVLESPGPVAAGGGGVFGTINRWFNRAHDTVGNLTHTGPDLTEAFASRYPRKAAAIAGQVDAEGNPVRPPTAFQRPNMGELWGQRFTRIMAYGSAGAMVYGGIQQARRGVEHMADYEQNLSGIRRVMNPLGNESAHLGEKAKELGVQYGQPIKEVMLAMREFASQGKDENQTIKGTEAALMAANVGYISVEEAVKGLMAVQQQYGISIMGSMKIVDAWNAVENVTAVSTRDLAKAVEMAGGVARNSGIDFNTFNAVIGTVGEATRRSGQTIGASMRFIFEHIRDPKAIESLQQVGIASMDMAGNFKTSKQVLTELSSVWARLTDAQKQNVGVGIAGSYELNDFIAMMDRWDRVLDLSIVSLGSQGSAMRENQIVMSTMRKQVAELSAAWEGLWTDMGQAGALDAIKSIVGALRDLLSVLKGVNKLTGGVLGGAMGTLGVAGVGLGLTSYFGNNILPDALNPRPTQQVLNATTRAALNGPGTAGAAAAAAAAAAARTPAVVTAGPGGTLAAGSGITLSSPGPMMAPGGMSSRRAGLISMVGVTAFKGMYDRYLRHAQGPDDAPSLTDTAVDVGTTAATTASMIAMFKKPGGYMKQGNVGKIGFALMTAAALYEIYNAVKNHVVKNDPNRKEGAEVEFNQINSLLERTEQGRTGTRSMMAVVSGQAPDMDMGKVGQIKNMIAALAPEIVHFDEKGNVLVNNLKEWSKGLDEVAQKLRGQRTVILAHAADRLSVSPEVEAAVAERNKLQQIRVRRQNDPNWTPQERLTTAIKIDAAQEVTNEVLEKFRTTAMSAAQAGQGMGFFTPERQQDLAGKTGNDANDVAKDVLQHYLSVAGSPGANVNRMLEANGNPSVRDVIDKGMVQYQKGGSIHRLADNQPLAVKEEDIKKLEAEAKRAGEVILQAFDPKLQEGIFVTAPEKLTKIIAAYAQAVDRLTSKNEILIQNIAQVGKSMESAAFVPGGQGVIGAQVGLSNTLRTGAGILKLDKEGAHNFGDLTTGLGNRPIQDELRQRIAALTIRSQSSAGIGLPGLMEAFQALDVDILKQRTEVETWGKKFIDTGGIRVTNTAPGQENAPTAAYGKLEHLLGPQNMPHYQESIQKIAGLRDSQSPKDREAYRAGSKQILDQIIADTKLDVSAAKKSATQGFSKTLSDRQQIAETLQQQMGTLYRNARGIGKTGSIEEFAKTGDFQAASKMLSGLTENAKTAQGQARTQFENANQKNPNSEEALAAKQRLDEITGALENLQARTVNFAPSVHAAVYAIEQLAMQLDIIHAKAGMGGAFGLTGMNQSQFAEETLTSEIKALGEKLEKANPSDKPGIQNVITQLITTLNQTRMGAHVEQMRRGMVNEGVGQAVLARQIGQTMGMQTGPGARPYAEGIITKFDELNQRIAGAIAPALKGRPIDEYNQAARDITKAMGETGARLRDLVVTMDTGFQKNYLLANANQRAVADTIRDAMRKGASAQEIFSDPYLRQAAESNPMLQDLMAMSLENDIAAKALEQGGELLKVSSDSLGIQTQILAAINALRTRGGLAPLSPEEGKNLMQGSTGTSPIGSRVGTMALAGTAAVDSKGRIRRDETPAVLHEGEVVLNKKQSDAFLKNRFASGTAPSLDIASSKHIQLLDDLNPQQRNNVMAALQKWHERTPPKVQDVLRHTNTQLVFGATPKSAGIGGKSSAEYHFADFLGDPDASSDLPTIRISATHGFTGNTLSPLSLVARLAHETGHAYDKGLLGGIGTEWHSDKLSSIAVAKQMIGSVPAMANYKQAPVAYRGAEIFADAYARITGSLPGYYDQPNWSSRELIQHYDTDMHDVLREVHGTISPRGGPVGITASEGALESTSINPLPKGWDLQPGFDYEANPYAPRPYLLPLMSNQKHRTPINADLSAEIENTDIGRSVYHEIDTAWKEAPTEVHRGIGGITLRPHLQDVHGQFARGVVRGSGHVSLAYLRETDDPFTSVYDAEDHLATTRHEFGHAFDHRLAYEVLPHAQSVKQISELLPAFQQKAQQINDMPTSNGKVSSNMLDMYDAYGRWGYRTKYGPNFTASELFADAYTALHGSAPRYLARLMPANQQDFYSVADRYLNSAKRPWDTMLALTGGSSNGRKSIGGTETARKMIEKAYGPDFIEHREGLESASVNPLASLPDPTGGAATQPAKWSQRIAKALRDRVFHAQAVAFDSTIAGSPLSATESYEMQVGHTPAAELTDAMGRPVHQMSGKESGQILSQSKLDVVEMAVKQGVPRKVAEQLIALNKIGVDTLTTRNPLSGRLRRGGVYVPATFETSATGRTVMKQGPQIGLGHAAVGGTSRLGNSFTSTLLHEGISHAGYGMLGATEWPKGTFSRSQTTMINELYALSGAEMVARSGPAGHLAVGRVMEAYPALADAMATDTRSLLTAPKRGKINMQALGRLLPLELHATLSQLVAEAPGEAHMPKITQALAAELAEASAKVLKQSKAPGRGKRMGFAKPSEIGDIYMPIVEKYLKAYKKAGIKVPSHYEVRMAGRANPILSPVDAGALSDPAKMNRTWMQGAGKLGGQIFRPLGRFAGQAARDFGGIFTKGGAAIAADWKKSKFQPWKSIKAFGQSIMGEMGGIGDSVFGARPETPIMAGGLPRSLNFLTDMGLGVEKLVGTVLKPVRFVGGAIKGAWSYAKMHADQFRYEQGLTEWNDPRSRDPYYKPGRFWRDWFGSYADYSPAGAIKGVGRFGRSVAGEIGAIPGALGKSGWRKPKPQVSPYWEEVEGPEISPEMALARRLAPGRFGRGLQAVGGGLLRATRGGGNWFRNGLPGRIAGGMGEFGKRYGIPALGFGAKYLPNAANALMMGGQFFGGAIAEHYGHKEQWDEYVAPPMHAAGSIFGGHIMTTGGGWYGLGEKKVAGLLGEGLSTWGTQMTTRGGMLGARAGTGWLMRAAAKPFEWANKGMSSLGQGYIDPATGKAISGFEGALGKTIGVGGKALAIKGAFDAGVSLGIMPSSILHGLGGMSDHTYQEHKELLAGLQEGYTAPEHAVIGTLAATGNFIRGRGFQSEGYRTLAEQAEAYKAGVKAITGRKTWVGQQAYGFFGTAEEYNGSAWETAGAIAATLNPLNLLGGSRSGIARKLGRDLAEMQETIGRGNLQADIGRVMNTPLMFMATTSPDQKKLNEAAKTQVDEGGPKDLPGMIASGQEAMAKMEASLKGYRELNAKHGGGDEATADAEMAMQARINRTKARIEALQAVDKHGNDKLSGTAKRDAGGNKIDGSEMTEAQLLIYAQSLPPDERGRMLREGAERSLGYFNNLTGLGQSEEARKAWANAASGMPGNSKLIDLLKMVDTTNTDWGAYSALYGANAPEERHRRGDVNPVSYTQNRLQKLLDPKAAFWTQTEITEAAKRFEGDHSKGNEFNDAEQAKAINEQFVAAMEALQNTPVLDNYNTETQQSTTAGQELVKALQYKYKEGADPSEITGRLTTYNEKYPELCQSFTGLQGKREKLNELLGTTVGAWPHLQPSDRKYFASLYNLSDINQFDPLAVLNKNYLPLDPLEKITQDLAPWGAQAQADAELWAKAKEAAAVSAESKLAMQRRDMKPEVIRGEDASRDAAGKLTPYKIGKRYKEDDVWSRGADLAALEKQVAGETAEWTDRERRSGNVVKSFDADLTKRPVKSMYEFWDRLGQRDPKLVPQAQAYAELAAKLQTLRGQKEDSPEKTAERAKLMRRMAGVAGKSGYSTKALEQIAFDASANELRTDAEQNKKMHDEIQKLMEEPTGSVGGKHYKDDPTPLNQPSAPLTPPVLPPAPPQPILPPAPPKPVLRATTGDIQQQQENMYRAMLGAVTDDTSIAMQRHVGGPTISGQEMIIQGSGKEWVLPSHQVNQFTSASEQLQNLLSGQKYGSDSMSVDAKQFMGGGADDMSTSHTHSHSGNVTLDMGTGMQGMLSQVIQLLQQQSGGASISVGDRIKRSYEG